MGAAKIIQTNESTSEETLSLVREISHPIWGPSLIVQFFQNDKICSFNCVYCSYGETSVKISQLKKYSFIHHKEVLRQITQSIDSKPNTIKSIIIAGNGEPTLHPQFAEMIHQIQAMMMMKNENKMQIVLKTNGAHLNKKNIVSAAESVDEVILKFDVATAEDLRSIIRPIVRIDIQDLVRSGRKLKNTSIEAQVIGGDFNNLSKEKIDDWLELVGLIEPERVFLIPCHRNSASQQEKDGLLDHIYFLESKIKRRIKSEVWVFEQDPLSDQTANPLLLRHP